MNITIGTDPELFVTYKDQIVSVIGLLGGTKEVPLPVRDGALQEDNVLAEFNITPCYNKVEFVQRINSVVAQLHERLGEGYSTMVKPSHVFDMEVLLANTAALQFGCDPDMNCWNQTVNPSPDADNLLRTAGGHVHIGYDTPNHMTSFEIAQMCDIMLGIPSILIDTDTQRREMYGKAGACRIKPYGVEYRTLSNFWLANDNLKEWVFDTAKSAALNVGLLPEVLKQHSPDYIQNIINESDVDAASKFVDEFDIEVPKYA